MVQKINNTKKYSSTLLLFSLVISVACGQKTFEEKVNSMMKGTVPFIQVEDLKNMKKDKDIYVLDIRSPAEYKISHIENAQLVTYKSFKVEKVKDIPKNATIIVYCSIGYRSERVGEKLIKAGYQSVNNLYGGIFNWKIHGLKMIDERGQPTDSVHTYNQSWAAWLEKGEKEK